MNTQSKATLAAAIVIAVGSAGCSSAYTRASAAYAKASGQSTDAVSEAPATAADLCRTSAHMAFLQKRLSPEGSKLFWSEYFEKETATATGLTWKKHCEGIDASGKLFSKGIAALAAYADSLGSLADKGAYDGSEIKDLADSASAIAGSLGNDQVSSAIKPVGGILKTFAGVVVGAYVERTLKDYTVRADPTVQALLDALTAYVDALDKGLHQRAEQLQRQTVSLVEKDAKLLEAPADPVKLVTFYGFAVSVDTEVEKARTTIDGYRSVLKKMKAAHQELTKAGQSGSDEDVKKVLGTIASLLADISSLKGALAGKE